MTHDLKILVISFLFTACFLCRVVVFSYRPITHKTFNGTVFYVFAYYLPELVPTVLQVYISESSNQKQETDTKYIASLYQEADSSVDDINEHRQPNERTRLWDGSSPQGSLGEYTVIDDYYAETPQ